MYYGHNTVLPDVLPYKWPTHVPWLYLDLSWPFLQSLATLSSSIGWLIQIVVLLHIAVVSETSICIKAIKCIKGGTIATTLSYSDILSYKWPTHVPRLYIDLNWPFLHSLATLPSPMVWLIQIAVLLQIVVVKVTTICIKAIKCIKGSRKKALSHFLLQKAFYH